MFGLSFPELLIVLVVALIVLGPERLPKVARTIGKGMREIRKVSGDFKDVVEGEFYKLDEEIKAKPELPGKGAAPIPGAVPAPIPGGASPVPASSQGAASHAAAAASAESAATDAAAAPADASKEAAEGPVPREPVAR